MSFTPTDRELIWDIVLAARRVRGYAGGLSEHEFVTDWLHQDAVIRQIGIIGEAAGKLSGPFREQHPDVPWSSIVGARNVLVRNYRDVDLHQVWNMVALHIPELLAQLEPLITEPND